MILRITADVDSAGVIEEPFTVAAPPYFVGLSRDRSGRITSIRVERQVNSGDIELPRGGVAPSGMLSFSTPTRDPAFTDLLDLIQFVESVGSFHLGIRRIYWANAEYEWVPESAEERRQLGVFSSKDTATEYPQTPIPVDPPTLFRLVRSRPRLQQYTIPMAFIREGVNDFRSFRYVNAYHSLYFFLEGLFGGGNTKNKLVERSFLGSPTLVSAVRAVLKDLPPRHHHGLQPFLTSSGSDWTPAGLIRFLIHMRGNLHHFSLKSTKPKGHPLNQREFESVAYLIFMVCNHVVVADIR